jgi:hypothetical protein
MGGREFATIAGDAAHAAQPQWQDFARLIAQLVLALPSFAPAGGPFAGHAGRIVAPHALGAAESVALATLYLALMCDLQLDALGATGTVIVDGPLAANPQFAPLLAALRPGARIERASGRAGALQAARILCGHFTATPSAAVTRAELDANALAGYRSHWRGRLS